VDDFKLDQRENNNSIINNNSDSGDFSQLEEAKNYNHRKNQSISENRKSIRYN